MFYDTSSSTPGEWFLKSVADTPELETQYREWLDRFCSYEERKKHVSALQRILSRYAAANKEEDRAIEKALGWQKGDFALLPWAPTAGMMMKKFRDEFSGGMSYADLDRAAAAVAPGSDGLILLPHLAGAVSPVAAPNARGAVKGLTLAHTRGHFARAIMESVAFLLKDNANALTELGMELKCVRALGGGAKSSLWAQIKADVLGLPVSVGSCEEPVALGAAILSAVDAGVFSSAAEAGSALSGEERTFVPGKDMERYQECFQEYCAFNEYILGEK